MTTSNGTSNPIPLLINGKEVTTTTTFPVTDPRNDETAWQCSGASKSDAISAIEAAQAAFPAWSRTTASERRDIFLRAATLMEERSDELSEYMAKETGGAAQWGGFNVSTTVEMMRDIAGRIAGALEGVIPQTAEGDKMAMVLKEPYGVVLGIAPWNAPYILGMRSIAYPIAAGNTAILKGSEFSPRVFLSIGQLFRDAGLPDGVLNVIYHAPSEASAITTALIEHPAVKKINFTGSTMVGSIIAATAGKHIKPVVLELGGKAPTIVMADADLAAAAKGCVLGSFLHAGQICMSTERIIIHESVKDEFVRVLRETQDAIFDPKGDAPVMVSAAGTEKTKKLVKSALEAGAKAITGSSTIEDIGKTRMRPIVLEGVSKEMDLYYAESFGPSVSLLTFSTEEEALAIANDTEYGLASAVFTRDLVAGLRIARKLEAGAVHINDMSVHDEPRLPHGGAKKSGFGRFGGAWGLDEFLRTKTITFKGDF